MKEHSMRKLTKTQVDKMTPVQRAQVARELNYVLKAYVEPLLRAQARLAELEAEQAALATAKHNQNIKDVQAAFEHASPSEKLMLALALAGAGTETR